MITDTPGCRLLSGVGKVYAKVLIDHVVDSTEMELGDDECGFRNDKTFLRSDLCW